MRTLTYFENYVDAIGRNLRYVKWISVLLLVIEKSVDLFAELAHSLLDFSLLVAAIKSLAHS